MDASIIWVCQYLIPTAAAHFSRYQVVFPALEQYVSCQEFAVCTRGHTTTPIVCWPPGRSCDPRFTQPACLLLQSQVGVVHAGQQHQLGLHTVSLVNAWAHDGIMTVSGKLYCSHFPCVLRPFLSSSVFLFLMHTHTPAHFL